MSKQRKDDPLIVEIQRTLMPGRFIPHDRVSQLSRDVDGVAEELAALARAGDAERAVSFSSAFCGWIRARQMAGLPAPETQDQILKWIENDNYGFCHEIEKDVVKVLNPEGQQLFIGHFESTVNRAASSMPHGPAKAIFEYNNDLRLPALTLKEIYESLADVPSYAALCGKLGFSPLDCERLAKLQMSSQHWAKALEWVEKGIALEPTRNWHNQSSCSLKQLKPEILGKLGRGEDALAAAWAEYQDSPNEFAYEKLMRHVPQVEKSAWKERAMAVAAAAGLGAFVSLCVKAKEWERLARRIHSEGLPELQALSHYCTEPAAKGLEKQDSLAAAKLYRALGMRILDAGKSKYYQSALDHFEQARRLYSKAGQNHDWDALVQLVRTAHSRKSGVLKAIEAINSGEAQRSPTFAEQAQARWKRLSS